MASALAEVTLFCYPTNMLPDLNSDYPLSSEQVAHYQTNGWALLRSVAAPDEVMPYREVITSMTNEFAKRYAPIEQRDTYGKAFIQFSNIWEISEDVKKFVMARRFAKIAAELMGVKGVRLYHDQALYKEPKGGHTPWHQDQQYWPLDGVKCVTLWMPLVDASAAMGTMRFASGSQALGYLGHENISDDSEARFDNLIKDKGYALSYAGDMAAGDATFHNGWTLHGAPGNADLERTREVMTIIYLEDDATISVPDHANRENDLKRWFPGQKPGEKVASPLNPLLYHQDLLP